ncbi:sensor histidine kinase, partial [Enterococcus faecium]
MEPAMAGRRLPAEVEAAGYFVALEAMANAQKHAPGATVTISLRSADAPARFVLEVHDDGPGFSPEAVGTASRGAGLQNMADRMATVGGDLTVDSRPGAGTWLRAEVPLSAEVVSLEAARR